MKGIAGRPLSAFVAYSRKRKNTESPPATKRLMKNKKQPVKLSSILPLKSVSQSEDDSSFVQKTLTPKQPRTKKKTKKRVKKILEIEHNGNSFPTTARILPESKKSSQSEATMENHSDDSWESADSSPSKKEVRMELSGSQEIRAKHREDSKRIERKKKGNKSLKKKIITSPMTKCNKESKDSEKAATQETISPTLTNNPIDEAKSLFQWLIQPVSIEEFFKKNWEKTPLQVRRGKPSYYKLLMSSPMLDSILRNFHIAYTKNIDITSYSNGQRETHNPPGRALPSVVWDYYSNGCSIRMLNPQTYIPKLHALNATLQEFFGCFVGANSYLTPPDSQGFAPHYDDIEAFILQIEGKKRWRLYKPANQNEFLPRYSSKNFEPSEIGEPLLDTVVEAGDLLYFPRGTIHQGETIDGTHSLHVTLSVYQKNSWCDFLEKLLPRALKNAIASDSSYRKGLPLDYLNNVGYVHSSKDNEARKNFIKMSKQLVCQLIEHIDIDSAADEMARAHTHDFLPPVLSPKELECSVLKDGERMTVSGIIENRIEIEPDTRIRLLRGHSIRLVEEADCMKIYFSTENSKEYHEYEPQMLEVGKDLAPAVKEIIRCYPNFIKVDDLPIEGEDNKVQVARDLWEKCIVVTEIPLPIIE